MGENENAIERASELENVNIENGYTHTHTRVRTRFGYHISLAHYVYHAFFNAYECADISQTSFNQYPLWFQLKCEFIRRAKSRFCLYITILPIKHAAIDVDRTFQSTYIICGFSSEIYLWIAYKIVHSKRMTLHRHFGNSNVGHFILI